MPFTWSGEWTSQASQPMCPFPQPPDEDRIPNRQALMGVLVPWVGTGRDASGGGGGGPRGQGLLACEQEGTGVVWRSRKTGTGAELQGSLWDELKTEKVGPRGAAAP